MDPSSGTSATALYGYLFVAVVILIIVRRTVGQIRGVRLRMGWLIGTPVILGLIYVALMYSIYYAGLASEFSVATIVGAVSDGAAVVVGVILARRHAARTLEIWPGTPPDTEWYYRIGPIVPLLYVVLYAARVLIELIVVGVAPFTVPTTLNGLAPLAVYSLLAVDVAWGASTGMVIGRNFAVLHRWKSRGVPLEPWK
ncbi:MAG: hypothetical protein ACREEC_08155 [Thermoplasmata archaeon]